MILPSEEKGYDYTVQHKKQDHKKGLLNTNHLSWRTLGYHPQTQKLEHPCTVK